MNEQESEELLQTLTTIVEVLEWTHLPNQAQDHGKWGLGLGPSGTAYRTNGPEGVLDPSKVLGNLQQRLERIRVAVGADTPRPKSG
jgi:hypothetical protein